MWEHQDSNIGFCGAIFGESVMEELSWNGMVEEP